ncbi:MAG: hypothetical protein IPP47_26980 [Bryobacterales bacterium]|nr:hypothetical protein [Bryobacterales bacterium]
MPEFPRLNSGVTTQYSFRRIVRRSVRTLKFLDGSEQRYATTRQGRRWVVNLTLLAEGEAARVDEFARRYFDTLEPFAFVDPVDGRTCPNCVLEGGEQWLRAEGEGRHMTRLMIAEELN